jgi:hypothetical protein
MVCETVSPGSDVDDGAREQQRERGTRVMPVSRSSAADPDILHDEQAGCLFANY